MDDAQILDVWTAGRADPAARPLLMLAAARPDLPTEALATLPVGQCNEVLLQDRQATFGDRLDGDVSCPHCGERLEVEVRPTELLAGAEEMADTGAVRAGEVEVRPTDLLAGVEEMTDPGVVSADEVGVRTAGLLAEPASMADDAEVEVRPADLLAGVGGVADVGGVVTIGEVEVRFRPPAYADLLAAQGAADADAAARVLLARCVLSASRRGEPLAVEALPDEVVSTLDSALEVCDPYADLRLGASCASCANTFELAVDPCGLYWAELAERARQLVTDVHRLASAYGWSERDILRIDPVRRDAYLELIG